jgi:hypothetical protein
MARKRDRRIAQAEALVRFGPERSTLSALLGEAKSQYRQDVRSARGAAKSAIRGARAARKPLQQVYDRALSQADVARQDVETAFGQIGAGADVFRAATERETSLNRQQIADASARAQQELTDRAQEARIGRQFAVGAARSKYRADLSQLADRLRDLGDREGAFVVGRLGELGESRANRRTQLQIQREAAAEREELENIKQQDRLELERLRQSGRAGGGGGGGIGGNKPATRAELRSFRSNFAKALRYANDYEAQKYARSRAADELTTGKPAAKIDGQVYPAVPSIGDQLALNVALDMAYGGVVSRRNAQRLHQIGIRVKDLPGAMTRAQRRRQQQRGFGGARDELAERY